MKIANNKKNLNYVKRPHLVSIQKSHKGQDRYYGTVEQRGKQWTIDLKLIDLEELGQQLFKFDPITLKWRVADSFYYMNIK